MQDLFNKTNTADKKLFKNSSDKVHHNHCTGEQTKQRDKLLQWAQYGLNILHNLKHIEGTDNI